MQYAGPFIGAAHIAYGNVSPGDWSVFGFQRRYSQTLLFNVSCNSRSIYS